MKDLCCWEKASYPLGQAVPEADGLLESAFGNLDLSIPDQLQHYVGNFRIELEASVLLDFVDDVIACQLVPVDAVGVRSWSCGS